MLDMFAILMFVGKANGCTQLLYCTTVAVVFDVAARVTATIPESELLYRRHDTAGHNKDTNHQLKKAVCL
jgi:hypothetical protein